MNKRGDLELVIYAIALGVFILLLFGVFASVILLKAKQVRTSAEDIHNVNIASLKSITSSNLIQIFLALVVIAIIILLSGRIMEKLKAGKIDKESKAKQKK